MSLNCTEFVVEDWAASLNGLSRDGDLLLSYGPQIVKGYVHQSSCLFPRENVVAVHKAVHEAAVQRLEHLIYGVTPAGGGPHQVAKPHMLPHCRDEAVQIPHIPSSVVTLRIRSFFKE